MIEKKNKSWPGRIKLGPRVYNSSIYPLALRQMELLRSVSTRWPYKARPLQCYVVITHTMTWTSLVEGILPRRCISQCVRPPSRLPRLRGVFAPFQIAQIEVCYRHTIKYKIWPFEGHLSPLVPKSTVNT